MKRHAHYCPIARSLDLLGDRWTILIIRELSFDDARFSTLRKNLVGVSPTLLTERLQTLDAHGLVTTRVDDDRASGRASGEAPVPRTRRGGRDAGRRTASPRPLYTLTQKGREALPILRAMSRFGMSLLGSPQRVANIRPQTAAYGALLAFYDADAAAGIDERYRLELDGETFDLATARGGRAPSTDGEPDLVLTGPTRAVIAARRGEISLDDAITRGVLSYRGSKRALRHFRRVFRLP